MSHFVDALFILSPDDRDGLCAQARALGWHATGARRTREVERRFLASEARIALVDVRDGGDAAARLRLLAPTVEAIGGALVALCPRGVDSGTLVAAGATHILFHPHDEGDLRAALDSAVAVVRRLGVAVQDDGDGANDALAGVDYLTGLAHRRAALGWLAQAVRDDVPPMCLLIGISQFDAINAAYGQGAGDAILARVAGRITRAMNEGAGRDDIVARVAGTEFLIGLRSVADGGERALLLARRIIAAMGTPFDLSGHAVRLTARCGIAEGQSADDAARLLRRAAGALADARRSGAGDICLRTTDRRGGGVDLDRLDADLRLALGRGEIGVVFQPQYDMRTDAIVGVEALARWNHPRLGQLGAAMLFNAAERSDFIVPLSRHIQREALAQAVAWEPSLGALRLSINVTASDLAQRDFIPHFLALIEDSGFAPERLTVEVTESGLIENISSAADLLSALRARGVRVAMDDFGTGYSSLAYLKALELDYLKIDSGLTRDIAGAPRDRIIVRGIIAMAKSLSLSVIAEGVESTEQLSLLDAEGVDVYQGFLRSGGVGGEELAVLVRAT